MSSQRLASISLGHGESGQLPCAREAPVWLWGCRVMGSEGWVALSGGVRVWI